MGLLLCVVAASVLVGWLGGGSLQRLAALPLHGWRLVGGAVLAAALGLLLSGLPGHAGDVAGVAGPLVAAALLALLLIRNRDVEGVPLIAAGLLLNAVVVAANGAMPVSLYAQARAGVSTGALADGASARHVLAGPDTRLRLLGDVVPVPLPVRPETVSAGDVLIVAGAGLLVVAGMHRRKDIRAG